MVAAVTVAGGCGRTGLVSPTVHSAGGGPGGTAVLGAGSSADHGGGGGGGADAMASPGANARDGCSPTCTADADCVNGSCVPRAGTPCTNAEDCPSSAICCDGSDETCDVTRIPSGDARNPDEFVISADGTTVADTITGLLWQRDGSGPRTGCSGTNSQTCTWDEAKTYCAGLTLDGVGNWRLPGEGELVSLVDFTRASPALDPTVFPGRPDDVLWEASAYSPLPFWTSSSVQGCSSKAYARYVDFRQGDSSCDSVANKHLVRCVRGARCYPKVRFVVLDGGLVWDALTGLVWQREVENTLMTWPQANATCMAFGPGFRLPTLKELRSIADLTFNGLSAPAIDPIAFPNTPRDQIWSSSTVAGASDTVWFLDFNGAIPSSCGNTDTRGYLIRARCVR